MTRHMRLLANDPGVELATFDEHADDDAWESLAVPGSPYAVVLAADGLGHASLRTTEKYYRIARAQEGQKRYVETCRAEISLGCRDLHECGMRQYGQCDA